MTTTLTKTDSAGTKLFEKKPGQNYIDLITDFFDNAKVAQASITDISKLYNALELASESIAKIESKVEGLYFDWNQLQAQQAYMAEKLLEPQGTPPSSPTQYTRQTSSEPQRRFSAADAHFTKTASARYSDCTPALDPCHTHCPCSKLYRCYMTEFGPICYDPRTASWTDICPCTEYRYAQQVVEDDAFYRSAFDMREAIK